MDFKDQKTPGVSREARISEEGLIRLEKQLVSGARMSTVVLEQWVRRYGDAAKTLILKYDQSYLGVDLDD